MLDSSHCYCPLDRAVSNPTIELNIYFIIISKNYEKRFETPVNRPTQYGDWHSVTNTPEASIEMRTTTAYNHDVTVTTRY